MNKKNVTPQANDSEKCLTIQDLPVEFTELSEKDQQQIVGGRTITVSNTNDSGTGSLRIQPNEFPELSLKISGNNSSRVFSF